MTEKIYALFFWETNPNKTVIKQIFFKLVQDLIEVHSYTGASGALITRFSISNPDANKDRTLCSEKKFCKSLAQAS